MPPFRLLPLGLALIGLSAGPAWAEDVAQDPQWPPAWPALLPAPEWVPQWPTPQPAPPQASRLEADQVHGLDHNGEQAVEAHGNVRLTDPEKSLQAQHLRYWAAPKERVEAEGQVLFNRGGDIAKGDAIKLDLETEIGEMLSPSVRFSRWQGRGDARVMYFLGEHRYRLQQARYTHCAEGVDDWYLRANSMDLDFNINEGEGQHVTLEFMGVPFLYSPYLSFPLSDARKSGFLAPILGTGNNGLDLALPYYWNIAPNRDATLTPRLLSKRGLLLDTEFRYLEPAYSGVLRAQWLPSDRLYHHDRYGLDWRHEHAWGSPWRAGLNLQRVSDDHYLKDLSSRVTFTSTSNLPRQAWVSYGTARFQARLSVDHYQTLQDETAPIQPPYWRSPQLLLTGNQALGDDWQLDWQNETTRFRHPTLTRGTRWVLAPSLSRTWRNPSLFLTPRLTAHYSRYWLDAGQNSTTPSLTINRFVPIFSVDSGLVFERDTEAMGEAMTQTLEPRLFYVLAPYRDQRDIPNFDTSLPDFSLSQLFRENRFTGVDKINDANALTMALTTRYLTQSTGEERLRLTGGLQAYFRKPQVQLDANQPSSDDRVSNLFVAAQGRISSSWRFDSMLQWNPNSSEMERFNSTVSYQPGPSKVLNLGYIYNRFSSETQTQVKTLNLSGQWPLVGRWYGVGQFSYSVLDRKPLVSLIGFEYNASCWVLRLVGERFVTSTNDRASRLFFQLELNDFARLGTNPLEELRQGVAGYQKINPSYRGNTP